MQSVSAENDFANKRVLGKDGIHESEEAGESLVEEEVETENEESTITLQPEPHTPTKDELGSSDFFGVSSSGSSSGSNSSSTNGETGILSPQPVAKKSSSTTNTSSTVTKDEEETTKKHGSITIQEMGYSFEGPDNPSGVTIKKFNVGVFA